jgi:hypothetical protein
MKWNYRIIKANPGTPNHVNALGIYEVCFDLHGDVMNWTVDPVAPQGDTVEELRAEIAEMMVAFEYPVLVERDGVLVTESDVTI